MTITGYRDVPPGVVRVRDCPAEVLYRDGLWTIHCLHLGESVVGHQ